MKLSNLWSRLRVRDLSRKRGAVVTRIAAHIESMEPRQLLSGSALFIPATGELNIGLNSAESVRITAVSGNVVVEVSTGGSSFIPLTVLGNVPAASVQSIVVLGGDEANTINLNGVTSADFTSLTSISIDGANGHDTITGSPDFADNIIGGHGNDTIDGQGGNDTINGGDSNDSITGGTGDDSITAGDGEDFVTGNDGNDTIAAGNGQDTISGGNGDDNIGGANGQDSLDGNAGNDTLNGDGGTDTLNGGDDNDSILGGEFDDSLDGGAGNDTMNGQSGNDTVDGNRGNDLINGGAGDDAVLGGADQDTVNGNAGNDRVFGDSGNDLLYGGAGNDNLMGMAGNDTVAGQAGNDTLSGGNEFDVSFDADVFDGGDGQDVMNSIGAPLLDMNITDVRVNEGSGGVTTAIFTVTLSQPLEFNVSVEYQTRDGSALAGSDYTADSGFLFFAPGQTVQTLSIDVTPDVNFDAAPSENFFIELINPERARLLRFQAEGTITDDDLPPPPPLVDLVILLDDSMDLQAAGTNLAGQFVPMMQTLQQQFQNSIAVGVARYENYSTAADRPFILNQPLLTVTNPQFTNAMIAALARTTPGTGAATQSSGIEALFQVATGAGFDGNGALGTGQSGPAGLVQTQLAPGTSGDVPNFNSFVPDATGPVVTATNRNAPDGVGFRTGSLRLVMMVTNNGFFFVDEPPASYVGVNNVVVQATDIEANGMAITTAGAATFTNTLAALLQDNIRVIGLGGDLNAGATPPLLAANPTVAPRLPLTGVATLTGGNNFSGLAVENGITAGPSPDDVQPGAPLYFVVNPAVPQTLVDGITEGAFASLARVNISVNDATSIELDTGSRTATFTVTIDNISRRDVTVDYSFLSGSAIDGVDFAGISGTLTFLGSVSGTPQLQQTITVDILGDELFESAESFTLVLSNPSPNALIAVDPITLLPRSTSVGTILDDDPAPDAGDVFSGGSDGDLIVGFAGNDTINGRDGNDTILGGDGNDVLSGGQGQDSIDGQAGDDTLDGQGGDDVLLGGDGNDTFLSIGTGGGNDTVDGNDGLNTITKNGTGNADTIAVTALNGALVVSQGGSSITSVANIQFVNVNGLGGDDTITIGDLTGVSQIGLAINGGEGNDFISGQSASLGGVRLAINGDNGNDTLIGTNGDDSIQGGLGNDAVNGQAGNDQIVGADGSDTLAGGLGNDTINGGNGNDFLTGQAGDDDITGGIGNDTLRGFEGNDTLQGQAGNDVLNGMDGDDSILGGTGLDAISGGAGNDVLDGGRNDDTINGNAGNDKIRGDHGNDYIDAGSSIDADTDFDTVNGGDGNDTIVAANGGDLLNGGDGNDRINAGNGDDIITGGDGNDTILGGGGNDAILGGDGDDNIDGQGGTDTIAGNQGLDVIVDPASEIDELYVLSAALLMALEATG